MLSASPANYFTRPSREKEGRTITGSTATALTYLYWQGRDALHALAREQRQDWKGRLTAKNTTRYSSNAPPL